MHRFSFESSSSHVESPSVRSVPWSTDSATTSRTASSTNELQGPTIRHPFRLKKQPICTTTECAENEVDFIELSDEPPTRRQLADAGDIPIFDAEGNSRSFGSLFHSQQRGSRQLVIFIRHFYCSACQAYLKALTELITPSVYHAFRKPTSITVIGCGEPSLIDKYLKKTRVPFQVYAEPTRRLYKLFNLHTTMSFGRRPDYSNDNVAMTILKAAGQIVSAGLFDGVVGGKLYQVGGELMFEEGKPVWFHRMRNIRGHADLHTLKRVLQLGPPAVRSSLITKRQSTRSSVGGVLARPRMGLVFEDPEAEFGGVGLVRARVQRLGAVRSFI